MDQLDQQQLSSYISADVSRQQSSSELLRTSGGQTLANPIFCSRLTLRQTAEIESACYLSASVGG